MTTISNSRRRRQLSLRTIVLVVLFIVLTLGVLLWRGPAASFLWRIVTPVLSVRDLGRTQVGGIFSLFAPESQLMAENRMLREALATSTIALRDRDLLYAENVNLKNQLGRSVVGSSVLASIVSRPPELPYDTLIIDVGKNAHISDGDFVSAEGSVYIGKVSQVFDTTSRVTLFSSSGQNYQALLRGTIPVAISGQGGGSLSGELPVGVEVHVGDSVLLPAIMPQFAAEVKAVVRHDGESFQTLYLQLAANIYELRYVHVHTN